MTGGALLRVSEVEIMGKRPASFASDIHGCRFDASSELRWAPSTIIILARNFLNEKVFSPRGRKQVGYARIAFSFFSTAESRGSHIERDYPADRCDEQRGRKPEAGQA